MARLARKATPALNMGFALRHLPQLAQADPMKAALMMNRLSA